MSRPAAGWGRAGGGGCGELPVPPIIIGWPAPPGPRHRATRAQSHLPGRSRAPGPAGWRGPRESRPSARYGNAVDLEPEGGRPYGPFARFLARSPSSLRYKALAYATSAHRRGRKAGPTRLSLFCKIKTERERERERKGEGKKEMPRERRTRTPMTYKITGVDCTDCLHMVSPTVWIDL
jgi:hypothetical protein